MEHHRTQLNTLFPGLFQGPHIKEIEVNDIKLKLMKLLKGYLSFLAPFCPHNLINKVLAEVSEVLYKLLVNVAWTFDAHCRSTLIPVWFKHCTDMIP